MSRMRDDAGMTLIELLLSIVILGLVIGPISAAVYVGLAVTKASTERTTDSAGAQLLSTYFPTDVHSADVVRTSGFVCGSGTRVVELEWSDADVTAAVPKTAVVYAVEPAAGDQDAQLRRQAFSVSGAACSQLSDTSLVRQLDSATPPVVTCEPTADCSAANTVTLAITAFARATNQEKFYAPYSFSLVGTRRAG